MTDLITRAFQWPSRDPDKRSAQLVTAAAALTLITAFRNWRDVDSWLSAYFACTAAYFAWQVVYLRCQP